MTGQTPDSPPRAVLLVTYYFPPSGGPGVQRMLKFAKYLPQFGWKPLVLTVREDAEYPARDPSLWRDVAPGTPVVRTSITEFYTLYRRLTRAKGPLDISARPGGEGGGRGVLRVLRGALFVPDGRAGWIPHALRPGERLAREHHARAILSSGPPFTANVIGGLLHRRLGIPWIQDFRDPWIGASFYPRRPAPIRRLDEMMERWTVRTADRTVAVNQEILSELMGRHRGIDPDRLLMIPNGFDEDDFRGIERTAPAKFTLVHTGSLFRSRDPRVFREALADLCRQTPGFADTTEVVLAGRVDEEVAGAFRAPPLDRVVRLVGYLPHEESLRLLRSTHVCLLFVGEEAGARGMLTGKLFEYLGSGTPILAIAPEGEASQVIRACRAGVVIDPAARDDCRQMLLQLWRSAREGTPSPLPLPDEEQVVSFSRRRLTGLLASILDDLDRASRPINRSRSGSSP